MYKIEDDVPMKKKNTPITKTALALKVGQSFVAPFEQRQVYARLATAIRRGMKFTTSQETETTTRIWRLA